MKSAELIYSKEFPSTPISGWCGANTGWCSMPQTMSSGEPARPITIKHPFSTQRKLWCLLKVHFKGVDLRFATPEELNTFISIMTQNPLPSGSSLVAGNTRPGRPNRHWLSRLPKNTHKTKFRKEVCKFLETSKIIAEFRRFYANQPVQYTFELFDGREKATT